VNHSIRPTPQWLPRADWRLTLAICLRIIVPMTEPEKLFVVPQQNL
jgi:hypothetical protein